MSWEGFCPQTNERHSKCYHCGCICHYNKNKGNILKPLKISANNPLELPAIPYTTKELESLSEELKAGGSAGWDSKSPEYKALLAKTREVEDTLRLLSTSFSATSNALSRLVETLCDKVENNLDNLWSPSGKISIGYYNYSSKSDKIRAVVRRDLHIEIGSNQTVHKTAPSGLLKVLSFTGESVAGGYMKWSLPTQDETGAWIPGEWHSLDKTRIMEACRYGLHLTTVSQLGSWNSSSSNRVFLTEVEGPVLEVDDKWVARTVRLVRELPNPRTSGSAVDLIKEDYDKLRGQDWAKKLSFSVEGMTDELIKLAANKAVTVAKLKVDLAEVEYGKNGPEFAEAYKVHNNALKDQAYMYSQITNDPDSMLRAILEKNPEESTTTLKALKASYVKRSRERVVEAYKEAGLAKPRM